MTGTPSVETLYRLPFSANDNPNGWVEITTCCNLRCEGCYRGCHIDGASPSHLAFEEITAQIDTLMRVRNCQVISLSGGEPFLHPQLDQIVHYIRQKGLLPLVLTNGSLLESRRLRELRKNGLMGLIIRIDSLREHRKCDETALNGLRLRYATLCKTEQLFCGITCVVDRRNMKEMPGVISWVQSSGASVDFLLLILKRQIFFSPHDRPDMEHFVSMDTFTAFITDSLPGLRYGAYLGSTAETETPKWLCSSWLGSRGKVLGYADKRFFELVQAANHFIKGKYFSFIEKKQLRVPWYKLACAAACNQGMRKAFASYLRQVARNPLHLLSPPSFQQLTIVNPPHFVDGKRDLCDGCPDAVLFNGRLVPSCILEEYKWNGRPVLWKNSIRPVIRS